MPKIRWWYDGSVVYEAPAVRGNAATVSYSYVSLQTTLAEGVLNPHAGRPEGAEEYPLHTLKNANLGTALVKAPQAVCSKELEAPWEKEQSCPRSQGPRPSPDHAIGFDLFHRTAEGAHETRRFFFAACASDIVSRREADRLKPLRSTFFGNAWIDRSVRQLLDVAKHPASRSAVAFVRVKALGEDCILPVRPGDFVVDRKTGAFYFPRRLVRSPE